MRLFDITLYLILFTVVAGVIDDIPFLNSYELPIDSTTEQDFDYTMVNGSISGSDDSGALSDIKLAFTATLTALKTITNYTLIYQIIMNIFATNLVPGSTEWNQIRALAVMIQTPILFIYGFTILQVWRKISTKHME